MLTFYRTTPLEDWIEHLYRSIHINNPQDLDLFRIARALDVWVYYLEAGSQAFERNGLRTIIIDRRLSTSEQWADFLHELCHLLRHAGKQPMLPDGLVVKQELEANLFQLYAALPFYMIKEMPLPGSAGELLELWIERFGVTPQLASNRLEQIMRRVLQGRRDEALRQSAAVNESPARRSFHSPPPYDSLVYHPETERLLKQLHRQTAQSAVQEKRNKYDSDG